MADNDSVAMSEQQTRAGLAGWEDEFARSPAALLVIDPQNDVLDETGSLNFWQVWQHARENRAVENIKQTVDACRAAKIPVIWAKQYRLEGGRDVFPGTYDGDMLTLVRTILPDAFMQDTWETGIFDDLTPWVAPGDIVIGKHGSNMFEGTALQKYLVGLGAKTLLVTGFLTDFCVEATVRSAADRGYRPVVISDACATENEDIHQKALNRMGKSTGPVLGTKALLNLIDRRDTGQKNEEERHFDLEEIMASMAEGLSLNIILQWQRYFNREQTALAVICPEPGRRHVAEENGVCEKIKALILACRGKGLPLFWIESGNAVTGENRAGAPFDELKALARPNGNIIVKPGASMFEATPLLKRLVAMGVNKLILCGVSTDGGIEASARQSSDLGFMTLIASDACGADSPEDHESALTRFDRLIGPVVATEELCGEIARWH